MVIIPILIVVASSVAYHIAQKYLAPSVNPVLTLLAAYVVAMIGSLLLFVVYPLKETLQVELSRLNVPNVVIGLSIIGIEAGWIIAYRAGMNINAGSLVANLLVALVLLPVGFLLFREHITPTNLLGVALCVVGLILVNQR